MLQLFLSSVEEWVPVGFFLFKQKSSKKIKSANMPFKVDVEKNWKLKTNMKLKVGGDEALRKVPSSLRQSLRDSWVKI